MQVKIQNYLQNLEGTKSDIIKRVQQLISTKSEHQRLIIAKKLLNNALNYRDPRLDIFDENASSLLKFSFYFQSFFLWQKFLVLMTYLFMYSAFFGHVHPSKTLIGIQFAFLFIFTIDTAMDIYLKKINDLKIEVTYFSRIFYLKIVLLLLLYADEIIVLSTQKLPVRPFLVIRCILPIIYDERMKQIFQGLIGACVDLLVYFIYFIVMLISFTMMANQFIEIPPNTEYDQFSQNYVNFSKTLFVFEMLANFDQYPDNQLPAIKTSLWVYGFFIVYIFLNIIIFSTIPINIVTDSMNLVRSRMIIINQIKQQHHLIMAFVALGGGENKGLKYQQFIKYIFIVYEDVDLLSRRILQICNKIDEKCDGIIDLNQFSKLCKLMQSENQLKPSNMNYFQKFPTFGHFQQIKYKFKTVLQSNPFQIMISIIVLLTFINSLLLIYTNIEVFKIIDDVLNLLFLIEVFFKFVTLEVKYFFKPVSNKFDLFLIIVCMCFQVLPKNDAPRNLSPILKMFRLFRLNYLIQFLAITFKLSYKNPVYDNLIKLLNKVALLFPILLKFIPLVLIVFYFFGVIGVQIFSHQSNLKPEDSPYSRYNQFSNFQTLLNSQFLLIQILFEAGWSLIAYDHAYRYQSFFIIMVFFSFMHEFMILVIASFLKGIIWQTYRTINVQHMRLQQKRLPKQILSKSNMKKLNQISEIKFKISKEFVFQPNTVMTRRIFETKLNKRIASQLFSTQKSLNSETKHLKPNKKQQKNKKDGNYQNYQSGFLDQKRIERQINILKHSIRFQTQEGYSHKISNSNSHIQLLKKKKKLFNSFNFQDQFNPYQNCFSNKESLKKLVEGLHLILQTKVHKRTQRQFYLKSMYQIGLINSEQYYQLLNKNIQNQSSSYRNISLIIRNTFLNDLSENKINRIQRQFFSSVYKNSFHQINNKIIQPLHRLQSNILYCLNNIFRYRNITHLNFFETLSIIQNKISKNLLHTGSLFKFVYQLDHYKEVWFAIDVSSNQQIRLHFIKNGNWIYHQNMQKEQIYYYKDFFKLQQQNKEDEQFVKKIYQNFEGLSYTLKDYDKFFMPDPEKQKYDLFTFFKNVQLNQRYIKQELSISKIMIVLLKKDQQRKQDINYSLTDIKLDEEKIERYYKKAKQRIKWNQTQDETYQKFIFLTSLQQQFVSEQQGLPLCYIDNFLTAIKQTLSINENNMIFHVQNILNKLYKKQVQIKKKQQGQNSDDQIIINKN